MNLFKHSSVDNFKKALSAAILLVYVLQPLSVFADETGMNIAPNTPYVSGPTTGQPGVSYTFSATASDPEGDQINFGFDWDNDGAVDNFSGYVGSGSTAQASYSWSSPGTYTFAVVARDAWGAYSDSSYITISIASVPPPVQNLPPNSPTVSAPSSANVNTGVTFTATANDPQGDNLVYGFDWNGDGNVDEYTSAVPSGVSGSASHSWSTPGFYTVRVYARDIQGASSPASSVSITINAPVTPPPAPINVAPSTPLVSYNGTAVNAPITFTATANDVDGDQINYGFDWDNDGVVDDYTGYVASGVSAQLSHTWTSVGTYTVNAYARDIWGNFSSSASVNVTVTSSGPVTVNTAPNTPFVAGLQITTVNLPETFTVTASDPQGDNLVYGFDWNNDGVVEEYTDFVASGVSLTASHFWTVAGTYTFKVYAKDVWNAVSNPATFTITVNAEVTPPVNLAPSNPTLSSNGTTVNTSITFTATATDPENDQLNYGFDWENDGVIDDYTGFVASGVSAQLSHTWTSVGTYTVNAYARDIWGNFSGGTPISITVTSSGPVTVNTAPNVPFVAGNSAGVVGVAETFTVTASDPQGDNLVYGFDWDNDGVVDEYTDTVASGVSETGTRTWQSAGTYTFKVYARDVWSAVSSPAVFTITISSPVVNLPPSNPEVSISGDVKVNMPITFTAVSHDPESDKISYGFDWDNNGSIDEYTGEVSSGVSGALSHSWSTEGSYSVKVYAKDSFGNFSGGTLVNITVTGVVIIVNTAPNAPTVTGPTTGFINTSYSFTFTSTDPQNDSISYGVDWDNDGSVNEYTSYVGSGTSVTVSHSFDSNGEKLFKVYARDSYDAISPASAYTITITTPGPVHVNQAPVFGPVSGPTSGIVNTSYSFTVAAADPENQSVSYAFDWNNDGVVGVASDETWSDFAPSNTAITRSNSWSTSGVKTFRIFARDIENAESSISHQISIEGGPSNENINFTLSPVSGLSTSENGGTAAFTIALESAPRSDVTFAIDSSDYSEGTTTPIRSVTFTPSNWNVYKTVIVTGVDDTVDDGDITYSVVVGPASSEDINWNGLGAKAVSLVNIDNDEGPVVVHEPGEITSFTASPATIYSGETTNLTWTSEHATLCVASDSWSGNKATSGTETVGPFTTNTQTTKTFVIACGNEYGTSTRAMIITLNPKVNPPTPVAVIDEFSINPTTVLSGGTATLSWASTDATLCVAGGDWSGNQAVDGSQIVGPYTTDTTFTKSFTLACGNSYGTTSQSVTLTVNPTPVVVPTATIDELTVAPGTVKSGESATVSWVSSNATLCVASDSWSGNKAVSGSESVGPFTTDSTITKTFVLACGNANGTSTKSAVLTINPQSGGGGGGNENPGTISSYAINPTTITSGATSTVSWTSSNATVCEASGAWSGFKSLSGSEIVGPFSTTTITVLTFTLACGNGYGTSTQSATLTVNPQSGGGGGDTTPFDFIIDPTSGLTTTEVGGVATFTVKLTREPGFAVTLPILSSDLTEGTTSTSTLVFDSSNWNIPQTVTVIGVDDSDVDGSIAYSVTVGASQSVETAWNNLSAKIVSVTNTDNDTAPVTPPTTPSSGGGGGGGGSGHRGTCIGFNCPATTTPSISDVLILLDSNPVATVSAGPANVCPSGNYLTTYMRIGRDNNPDEVRKLQIYLNRYENAGIAVSGVFDVETEQAVKDLQVNHTEEILAPWGVTEPTGIVYITTTRYINTVTCPDNIKDITNDNVLYPTSTPDEGFEGAIGQATSTLNSNLAALFAAIKDISWYALLIILLITLGTSLILSGILRKDRLAHETYLTFIKGSTLLAIGTVLNVLNSLSYILNPQWFTLKTGLTLTWLLGLDIFNFLALLLICLVAIIDLYRRTRAK